MRLLLTIATGIGLLSLLALTTQAQDEPKRDRPKPEAGFFDRLDVNKDGVITVEELPDSVPAERRERVRELIKRTDKNGDGKVTREEFEAAYDSVRPQPKRPEAERPDGAGPEGERRPAETGRPFGFGGPDLFRMLDADGDGTLSRDELSKAVDVLMKHDRNGDGSVSPEELAEGFRAGRPGLRPRPPGAPAEGSGRLAAGMIRRADKNGDGKLSKDELPEMMRGRFEQMDSNGDGFVDERELAQAAAKLREARGDAPDTPRRPLEAAPGARAERPDAANDAANRERIAALLRQHDKDADGRISASEFGADRAEEFKKLDANGDGYLTADEIARGLAAQGTRPGERPRRESNRKPNDGNNDE